MTPTPRAVRCVVVGVSIRRLGPRGLFCLARRGVQSAGERGR